MFSYITSLFTNPKATLMFVLLAFPGRLLAISAHEYAHAWMADRCGDPTARLLGRMTLNPLKHLDPIGAVMMLLLGFGWARPVPVNPYNYRNYRRDDLKVSLAGVTMNLILFLLGFSGLTVITLITAKAAGHAEYAQLLRYCANLNPDFVADMLGRIPSYIYQMLVYFVYVNLSLAIFNLIPMPPLDGYHVLNDLILKRDLFAGAKIGRAAMGVMFLLMFTGVLGRILGVAVDAVLAGAGRVAYTLLAGLF